MLKYKNHKRLCFLDTETTSVYWNSAAPVQIAAIICDETGKVLDSFNERIKTTRTIDPGASEVHGIFAEDLVNCRSEREVIVDFCSWLLGSEIDAILTYNGSSFDLPMLNVRCDFLGIETNAFSQTDIPSIDIKAVVFAARKRDIYGLKSLGRKWALTLVAEKLGVLQENAHDALQDVKMSKDIWFKLDPIINPQDWTEEGDNNESGSNIRYGSLF